MIKRPFRASGLRHGRFSRRGRFRKLADYALAAAILGLLALVAARIERVATLHHHGAPVVNDGDTITIAGERLRLQGIDAPELSQTCMKGGSRYPCGRHAREALAALIGGQPVSCSGWKRDRYGRLLATCKTARGADINRRLVEQGWAVAYGDYADAESAARAGNLGLWAGSFDRPGDWRTRHGEMAEIEPDLLVGIWNRLKELFRWP